MAILARPARAWDEIDAEPADPRWLIGRYVALLAAIPAVCGVAGARIFGFNIASIGVHMSLGGLIFGAVAGYVLTLVAVWVLAIFLDLVAPTFGGLRNRGQALKLAAYSGTATWVGGLAELYPSLGIPVGILAALYSFYVLYLGLPKLMRIPPERRLMAFFAVLLAILILAAVRNQVAARAAELGGPLSASYVPSPR